MCALYVNVIKLRIFCLIHTFLRYHLDRCESEMWLIEFDGSSLFFKTEDRQKSLREAR